MCQENVLYPTGFTGFYFSDLAQNCHIHGIKYDQIIIKYHFFL